MRRKNRVLQAILAPLGPQDLQDQLDQLGHLAMDPGGSLVQRAPKDFLEPLDHPEKPVLGENSVCQHQFRAPQGLQGPLAMPAPEVHLASLDPWGSVVILVFPGLMVNQEFQELDFLGLLDLRETEVFQEQKDHWVLLEKWESLGYLESRDPQDPRENQH